MTCTKEVAKFFAGVAACETIGHWWLGIWGGDLLPMQLRWFTFTPELNMFAMAFWPMLLAALVYYAWMRQAPARERATGPVARAV